MTDDFSILGKTVVVTGAAGAIGQRLVAAILNGGGSVIATDRFTLDEISQEFLDTIESEAQLAYFSCDLTSQGAMQKLCDEIVSNFSVVDGIVHNAALVGSREIPGWSGDFLEQSLPAWEEALQVNLTAPFFISQKLYPSLEKAESPSIVSISSMYGLVGPNWSMYAGTDMSSPAAYAASKGGLISLTRWLATTLAPKVRVNSLALGGIFRNQPNAFVESYIDKTPMKRMAREEDAIGAALFLLSNASNYMTGQTLVVDGGYTIQ